jgi:hypothetical protein
MSDREEGWVHPELQEGETCLGNTDEAGYEHYGWSTLRRGIQAYDICDRPINDRVLFPVFVQRSELQEAGIDPDTYKSL